MHITFAKQAATSNALHKKWRIRRIQKIKELFPEAKKILCIGARNDVEVSTFIDYGYEAIGIDVCKSSELIKKIDAHELIKSFNFREFDVVYACHVLEHMHHTFDVMRQIRLVSTMGISLTLPFKWNAITPCIGHPSIFDIMLDCPPSKDLLTPALLEDFQVMKPFEVGDFYKSTEYEELDLYLRWL